MKMQRFHPHQQPRSDHRPSPAAMASDHVSVDKSKSFVKALQELKNLRPQLYSAAEYCEKSYLNSEQKQMVLDNLKDYAVRALVNAVDHLGTVAYKLTDVLEHQSVDISAMELKVSCVNQQLLTCQTYMNKEGLRQQELLSIIPRHHKHYTLPNIVNKKVSFSPHIRTSSTQSQNQSRMRFQPSAATPAAKTLSWHLASETKSTLKRSSRASIRMDMDGPKSSGKSPGVFHLSDVKESTRNKHSATHLQFPGGGSASSASVQTSSVAPRYSAEGNKHMTPFRSFGSPTPRVVTRAPARSKSMMSTFFAKHKTQKVKTSAVS